MSQLLKWNAFCRKQQPAICFIAADVRGVAGFAFSDFGPQFTVFDRNGEGTRTTSVLGALNVSCLVPHDFSIFLVLKKVHTSPTLSLCSRIGRRPMG